MKRVLILLLALLFALSGCGGGSSTAGGAPAPGFGDSTEFAPAPDAPSGESARDEGKSQPDRQIARSANVTLRVDDTREAAASIRLLVAELKGWVVWEEMYDTSSSMRAYSTITVQVPSNKLDEALERLADFGTTEHRIINSLDVTEEVVDIDSRVKTMRESIARLNALMEKSGSLADIAAIEGELTKRQAELESLLARQKALATQVEMSQIEITLVPKGAEYVRPNPFVEGLQRGWYAFTESIVVMIIVVGALLPFAIVVAVIVVPLATWIRRRRAARRKQGASVPPPHPMPNVPPTPQAPPAPQETPAPAAPPEEPKD